MTTGEEAGRASQRHPARFEVVPSPQQNANGNAAIRFSLTCFRSTINSFFWLGHLASLVLVYTHLLKTQFSELNSKIEPILPVLNKPVKSRVVASTALSFYPRHFHCAASFILFSKLITYSAQVTSSLPAISKLQQLINRHVIK